MQSPPSCIIICHSCDQDFYQLFHTLGYPLKLIKGLPDIVNDLPNVPKDALIIFDDLQHLAADITPYFTKYSHHCKLSIIYLSQNLFLKPNRTITLNSNYIILFKSPRDKLQIRTIAQQMAPGNASWIMRAYNNATRDAHSYVLIDYVQNTHDDMRLRDNIIPTLGYIYVDDTQYDTLDIRSLL